MIAGALALLSAMATPADAAPQKAEYDPDRVTCRTTRTTGSRLARTRTCMSERQRIQEEEDLRRNRAPVRNGGR
jgi:hypothetical protein